MHTIEVSFQVWQALTARLKSEHDTYSALIGRVLGLQEPPASTEEGAAADPSEGDWMVKGVRFPAGMEFRGKHKGRIHTGRVENGALALNGKRYDSPSDAGHSITGYNVNGWKFWECRLPNSGEWRPMVSFRRGI